MDERQFITFFKAFGDSSRLRILHLLSKKEMTVNEIAKAAKMSQPTVSRHLGILRAAGVVVGRREGQYIYYALQKKAVECCCLDFCCTLMIPSGLPAPGKKK